MSRSIHTTKQEIDRAKHFDFSDSERKAELLEALEKEAKAKRRIKHHVNRERGAGARLTLHSDIEHTPVSIRGEDPYAHYPASPDDIREVMRALPAGVLDGLACVELSLGADHQDVDRLLGDGAPDPLTGRPGIQVLPGVYCGQCLGMYRTDDSVIRVFAHVYDPSLPGKEMWETYLRLQMLSTFVHEAAHHYDFTMRVARGRWRMDDNNKVEIYAETVQHEWVQSYVIPYLQTHYREEIESLCDWIEHYGGVAIPFEMLAGDPRTTLKNGLIRITEELWGIPAAVGGLANDVADGKTLRESRLGFARELHYSERYEMALQIIERVLASEPGDLDALTLKADVYQHQERCTEARELAEAVVSADHLHMDAWQILGFAYEDLEEWQGLLEATTHLLSQNDLPAGTLTRHTLSRARARAELRDFAGAEADLATIESLEWRGHTGPPSWVHRKIEEVRRDIGNLNPTPSVS